MQTWQPSSLRHSPCALLPALATAADWQPQVAFLALSSSCCWRRVLLPHNDCPLGVTCRQQ